MQSSPPLVSVLMTAYNREDYIAEAIESVLHSSYSTFELIIVDDCSHDNTVQIIQSYADQDKRIRVFQNQQNLGDYPNRNKAASYAKGKYLKYIDSDNIIYKYGLQIMVESMEAHPEAALGLLSESDPHTPYPVIVSPYQAYYENFFESYGYFGRAPDSAIIKTQAFNHIKGFSGRNMIGDYELWMKMALTYPILKLQPYLGWDRQHIGQQKNIDPLIYQKMRDTVVNEYLQHDDCPLTTTEINLAYQKKRNRLKKNSYYLLYKGNIKQAIKTFIYALRS